MTAEQDSGAAAETSASLEPTVTVDARRASGVAVGEGFTQINYIYSPRTWGDGVVAPPLVDRAGRIDSPYRGLSAFEERDRPFFFGRDEAADQILQRMSKQLDGDGLLVISGVSGVGKSSLLRAGVLPRLRGEGLTSAPEAATWPCLMFPPKDAPLCEMAVRVANLAKLHALTVQKELADDPAGFSLTARQAAWGVLGDETAPTAADLRLLLVIDQFEQLFTQCHDEQQRRAFIMALHAATARGENQQPAAMALLAVRSDFEARCADYPELSDAVQRRYLVTPMSERQLRLAIIEPAKMAGSAVEDALVGELVEKVIRGQASLPASSGLSLGQASRAGVLPLLSYVLDEAWRLPGRRTESPLSLADYERAGGIEGAVAASAQRAYNRLTPAQRTEARNIFIRLTATSPDGTDLADRVSRAELFEGKNPAETDDIEAVLKEFATKERLLTLAAGTVEISHEILLTAWPLLRDEWLAETREQRRSIQDVREAARRWERGDHDTGLLVRGRTLASAARRLQQQPNLFDTTTRVFIIRSFVAETQSEARLYVAKEQFIIPGTSLPDPSISVAIRQATSMSQASDQALQTEMLESALSFHVRTLGPSIAAMYWREMWLLAWKAEALPGTRSKRVFRLLTRPANLGLIAELIALPYALYLTGSEAVTLISNSVGTDKAQAAALIASGAISLLILWRFRTPRLRHALMVAPFVFLYSELAVHIPVEHGLAWALTAGIVAAALGLLALFLRRLRTLALEAEEQSRPRPHS